MVSFSSNPIWFFRFSSNQSFHLNSDNSMQFEQGNSIQSPLVQSEGVSYWYVSFRFKVYSVGIWSIQIHFSLERIGLVEFSFIPFDAWLICLVEIFFFWFGFWPVPVYSIRCGSVQFGSNSTCSIPLKAVHLGLIQIRFIHFRFHLTPVSFNLLRSANVVFSSVPSQWDLFNSDLFNSVDFSSVLILQRSSARRRSWPGFGLCRGSETSCALGTVSRSACNQAARLWSGATSVLTISHQHFTVEFLLLLFKHLLHLLPL